MTVSTLNRKAWGDLTRHRARTLLAVFTLSIAIASLGFLAVPALLNAAMNRQIAESHLYDVGIFTRTLDLRPAQLGALGRLPGVAAVSPAVGYATTATSAAGPRTSSSPAPTWRLRRSTPSRCSPAGCQDRARCWPMRATSGPPASPSPMAA